MDAVPATSSHHMKLDVTEMKMCRWACGHTPRYHMRNDKIRENDVENTTEKCRKAKLRWFEHGETKNTSEEIHWRWYHKGEECEGDRRRDGWTVSTGT